FLCLSSPERLTLRTVAVTHDKSQRPRRALAALVSGLRRYRRLRRGRRTLALRRPAHRAVDGVGRLPRLARCTGVPLAMLVAHQRVSGLLVDERSPDRKVRHRRQVTGSRVGRTSPPRPCPAHPVWHAGIGSSCSSSHGVHATAWTTRPAPTRTFWLANSSRCAAAKRTGSSCVWTGMG